MSNSLPPAAARLLLAGEGHTAQTAVYLDGGLAPARELILRHWPKPEDVHRPMQDSKGALQEHLQKDGGDAPTYQILAQDGPPHDRTFHFAVRSNDVAAG